MRDMAAEKLDSEATAIVGISGDAPAKQKKFDEKHSLGYPLLSDPNHEGRRGVWGVA